MKVLNLYAGLGGNRKLWPDYCNVTAVENNESIANIYKKYHPKDIIIIEDAHEYLLHNIRKFDFIWASPPCPTHSKLKLWGVFHKTCPQKIVYPDMKLYQEIILLKYFAKKQTKWVVENVQPYYSPLIEPQVIINRSVFWTNFYVRKRSFKEGKDVSQIANNDIRFDYSLKNEIITIEKRTALRNLINPEVGLYIFNESLKGTKPLFNFDY